MYGNKKVQIENNKVLIEIENGNSRIKIKTCDNVITKHVKMYESIDVGDESYIGIITENGMSLATKLSEENRRRKNFNILDLVWFKKSESSDWQKLQSGNIENFKKFLLHSEEMAEKDEKNKTDEENSKEQSIADVINTQIEDQIKNTEPFPYNPQENKKIDEKTAADFIKYIYEFIQNYQKLEGEARKVYGALEKWSKALKCATILYSGNATKEEQQDYEEAKTWIQKNYGSNLENILRGVSKEIQNIKSSIEQLPNKPSEAYSTPQKGTTLPSEGRYPISSSSLETPQETTTPLEAKESPSSLETPQATAENIKSSIESSEAYPQQKETKPSSEEYSSPPDIKIKHPLNSSTIKVTVIYSNGTKDSYQGTLIYSKKREKGSINWSDKLPPSDVEKYVKDYLNSKTFNWYWLYGVKESKKNS
ncbi:MAG: hypothetical protein ACPLYW_00860 [Candidatus Nanoarchaeia archaeon]